MIDFLFALIELFHCLLRFRSYEAKYIKLKWKEKAVFAGGWPLCTQVLHGQGRPHQPFLAWKTRDTGLPDGEDRIRLRSLVLTQYRSVADRQTDRRTDGFTMAYTAFAKLVMRHAVKTNSRGDHFHHIVDVTWILLIRHYRNVSLIVDLLFIYLNNVFTITDNLVWVKELKRAITIE